MLYLLSAEVNEGGPNSLLAPLDPNLKLTSRNVVVKELNQACVEASAI